MSHQVPTITKYVNELTPHPDNYNTHPKGQISQLAESLTTFGQFKNMVAWTCPENMTTPDGIELHEGVCYILAGHGLWLAAMEAGIDELEVKDYSGLSYEMALSLLMVDNAAPLGSEPIADKLAALLDRTRHLTADKPGLAGMLEQLRIRAGVNGKTPPEDNPPIDKAGDLQKIWNTAQGQIWQLGNHRLIVGDCTDRQIVESIMSGEKARLVVADPPYGVSYADKNKFLNAISRANRIETPIENDHSTKEETQAMWKAAFSQMSAVMDAGAVVYCFMPQGGDQMMMMMMMMMMGAGIEPRHEIIWLKNNHVLGRVDYAYKHEPILYAWKEGGHRFYGDFQTSILEYPKSQISDLHPTQKPVALIERLISNSSLPNEVVYDPFTGSGTVIVACENLGRRCRAIELDPGYCAVTLQRWADLTQQQPRLVSG